VSVNFNSNYLTEFHSLTFDVHYYRAAYLDFIRMRTKLAWNSFILYSVTVRFRDISLYKYKQYYFLNYPTGRGIISWVVTYETQKEIFTAKYPLILLYDTSATLSFLHLWRHFTTIRINVTGDDTCKLKQCNFELLSYDLLKYA
jgi:hypothetical protein